MNKRCVVVGFWPSSESQHESCLVKSVPSEQRTQRTSRLIMDPRRKPRVLPWAHIRPELPTWICNYQVLFRTTSVRVIHPDAELGWNYSTTKGPASTMKALREESRFYTGYNSAAGSPWFTDSVTLSDHPHALDIITPLLQCGMLDSDEYLCMTIPTIKRCDLWLQKNHNVTIVQLLRSEIPIIH